jgi:endonuclease/exonuclease/phosphatase family metal-dependent hydrolase
VITASTSELRAPTVEERRALRARVGDRAVHADALRGLPALQAVETGGAAARAAAASVRIAAWNGERGRHPAASAALIEASGAEVALLSEMDLGMARTGQRHTTADLAGQLSCTYAFGVEFVELSRGSPSDHRVAGGLDGENDRGLHGNAVLSAVGFSRPALVRLSGDGAWFGDDRAEPRVGGRMALLATVPFGPEPGELAVASVHLESASSPADRAAELTILLDALEEYAGDRPVVIGGDLNTCSASPSELVLDGVWDALLAEDPGRYVDPVQHEPLFAAAAARGYQWEAANVPGPTTRFRAGSRRWRYAMRLDWILTRGVACRDAATYAAVDRGDLAAPISDHDLLAVTVSPAPRSLELGQNG